MERRVSAHEWIEWQAYHALEPIGAERADLNAGIIAAVIANVHRDPKRKPDPFTAADFMPIYDRKEAQPIEKWRQQKAAMKALQAAQKKAK